jgi:hypothetical protein
VRRVIGTASHAILPLGELCTECGDEHTPEWRREVIAAALARGDEPHTVRKRWSHVWGDSTDGAGDRRFWRDLAAAHAQGRSVVAETEKRNCVICDKSMRSDCKSDAHSKCRSGGKRKSPAKAIASTSAVDALREKAIAAFLAGDDKLAQALRDVLLEVLR